MTHFLEFSFPDCSELQLLLLEAFIWNQVKSFNLQISYPYKNIMWDVTATTYKEPLQKIARCTYIWIILRIVYA